MRSKKAHKTVLLFFTMGLVTASFIANAETVSRAEMLADQCFSCHGTNGVGSGKIPELLELDKDDITESLNGFKSGSEKSTIMGRHAKAYSDEEIEMLADYFISLKNK
jgi:sulfide dehydrogenase cytochrome subunit